MGNYRHIGFCIAAAAAMLCGCMHPKKYVIADGAMIGTTFHVCAETDRMSAADIYAAMMRIEREARASMSIFDDESLLNRINRNETDSLDDHLLRNFTVARIVGERIDARYDITVKPLTEAWGFAASKGEAEPNIDSLLAFVGYDKWRIEGNRVVKSDPRVQFDLNSIAKGYTVDMAGEMLEAAGIVNYLVEIGGEVRCRGVNRSGELWTIGIDAPYDGNIAPGTNMCGSVRLDNRSLATSGNYRRFHIDSRGRKIVHTINPATGMGASSRLLSATVAASECVAADALATLFMAVGADDAMVLAERMRDSVEVFFIFDSEMEEEFEFFNNFD